jgi:hypothetical protein
MLSPLQGRRAAPRCAALRLPAARWRAAVAVYPFERLDLLAEHLNAKKNVLQIRTF